MSDGGRFAIASYLDPSAGAWTSTNARSWQHTDGFVGEAHVGDLRAAFTTVGTQHTVPAIARSSDGRTWTVDTSLPARLSRPLVADHAHRHFYAIQFEPGVDVAGGRLMTSTDAHDWHEVVSFHEQNPVGNPDHLVQSGRWWVLGGNRNAGQHRRATMWVSRDLRTWKEMPARLRGPENSGDSVLLATSGRTVVGVSGLSNSLWIWRRPSD
jgi:hypothetical protein